jgi:hypothetical protein
MPDPSALLHTANEELEMTEDHEYEPEPDAATASDHDVSDPGITLAAAASQDQAAKGYTPRRVVLKPEDRTRMFRLYEEVQGRLEEMALIATRVHGLRLDPAAVRRFAPHEHAVREDDAPAVVSVEIIDFPDGGNACMVVYSDDHAEVEIPCGATG